MISLQVLLHSIGLLSVVCVCTEPLAENTKTADAAKVSCVRLKSFTVQFSVVHSSYTLYILFLQGVPCLYAITMLYCTCGVRENLVACCRSADQNNLKKPCPQLHS
jgi:hypothetical protein